MTTSKQSSGTLTVPKTYTAVACHKGTLLVFKAGIHTIYGAGRNREPKLKASHVIVDLADNYGQAIKCSGIFEELEQYNHLKIIKIQWADFGLPSVVDEFWESFANMILDSKEPLDIVFICDGGHGRTGTALSIIGSLLGCIPEDECPVEYTRRKYCKNAVETHEQLDYVEEITGRKVTAQVPDKYGSLLGYGDLYKF